MKQPGSFIPFSLPSIGIEEEEAVLRVLRSGWLTTGKEALAFEKEFALFTGSPHALAVNSATSGLQLAMEACGITKDTAILTSPYTFIATSSAALHLNASVQYCDIEKDTYNIDPEKIEDALKRDRALLKPRIKAVVPIHIAGNVCRMQDIMTLAKKYEVYIIEDAAHSFPSKTDNGYAGTIGDIGVFSFYATKTITTAEGGMVCTANDELAKRMTTMRMHGIDRSVWDRYTADKASWEYDVIEAGYKYNLPDILAAIGREQLKKADFFLEKRIHIIKQYNQAFAECPWIIPPPDGKGNAWHLYLLNLDLQKISINRNNFSQFLQEDGIGVSMHFIPHFLMSFWKKQGLDEKDFPNAKTRYESTISLPLWPDMTQMMIDKVIETVIKTGRMYGKY
ncbi:MAG TPA: DegT/DnrJ/EryC1/StrS aminotransferase family protein [Treponemataceae bacterium]|nr:DegT/DnrJ/EryC1/StrS aminotransferase family protein [Treponemataceae bacterium]HQL03925.1 DegT/DnrJ/EryC1/StrS aminotransferase family protein [Treponemataceae bacterium]